MRILITGTKGQVGWELRRSLSPLGEVIAPSHADFDLADPEGLLRCMRAIKPDIVVNPAAYTAVDKAETEVALAQAINGDSVGVLARECTAQNALLVHYSTDYVFDGSKAAAYEVSDATGPVSAYGRTKLAGEEAIRVSGCRHVVIRTSWVYGTRGHNFLLTMLKLARERDSLRVVADQFGAPTTSRLLADGTAQILARIAPGSAPAASLVHLTGAGHSSWHGFASRIVEWGAELGLCKTVSVNAITTADYPTPARRPVNSLLSHAAIESAYGLKLPHWEHSLRLCLEDLAARR